MDKSKIDKKARNIELKADSKKEFFLIHGYTGSPTDFNKLGEYLYKRFNANVKIIRLVGHGTRVEDLDKLEYRDFLAQVENELKKDINKGNEIVIGGYSFGSQLSLKLASMYPIRGIFTVSVPHKLKFPFNIPFLGLLGIFKKKWKKRLKATEIKLKKQAFHYKEMHAKGLGIIKKGIRETDKVLEHITAPILSIHSKKEPIAHYSGVEYIVRKVKSGIKKSLIFERPNHNLFYSEDREEINRLIGDFFEENKVFESAGKDKIAAIVPSYNEADRIGDVLKVLTRAKILDEVIVVDDGSNDRTQEIAKKFRTVKYIRNRVNMGKGYSMDLGVKNTNAQIIFFCDADVINLTPEIIEDSVRPVINNEVDMFIAVRGNVMQKAVKLFAVNSGERALRRKIWERLPKYYKHRFRIEAGLNHFVKNYGKGFGYRIFSHTQPIKEIKYGFFEGTIMRWWMNFDVLMAYISCFFMKGHLKRTKKNIYLEY